MVFVVAGCGSVESASCQAFLKEMGGSVGWGGPHLEKWLRYAEARMGGT